MATTREREDAAVSFGGRCTRAALFSTVPTGDTAGTEISGGTPAYARKPITWTAGAVDGTVTASVIFDVPAGAAVRSVGLYDAAGVYRDVKVLTDPNTGSPLTGTVPAQGTLTVALTANAT